MTKSLVFVSFLLTFIPSSVAAQMVSTSGNQEQEGTATVEVLGFASNGGFIQTSPSVEVFENYKRKNLAEKFKNGVAEGVPFGVYRMKGYVQGFLSEERTVWVFQRHTTIILGLTVGGIDFPITHNFRGRVFGKPLPTGKKSFVKLSGIFSGVSAESLIGADGGFEVGNVPDGNYLLLVVSDDSLIAIRQVHIPNDQANFGVPYVIDVRGKYETPSPER